MDEYNLSEAQVIAMMETSKIHHGNQSVVTYSLKKQMQKFGEPGKQSALNEMKQLHDKKCFKPVKEEDSLPLKRKELWNPWSSLLRRKMAPSWWDIVQMEVQQENGSLERSFQSYSK